MTAIKFSNDGQQLAAVLHHQGRSKLLMLNPNTGEILKTLAENEARDPETTPLDFSAEGGSWPAFWGLAVAGLPFGTCPCARSFAGSIPPLPEAPVRP